MKAMWFVWMFLLPVQLAAQQYVAINLPSSLGTQFGVRGINPGGSEIVGSYYDGVKVDGVKYSNGTFSTIAFPAGIGETAYTYASGVNDAGTVVGNVVGPSPAPVSPQYGLTYYTNQAYATYVAPGPKMTWFNAINNQGIVAGYYQDWNCQTSASQCNVRGFILNNGSLTTLLFPGSLQTPTAGINTLGEVAGNYETAAGSYGFTWKNGVYTEFTRVSGSTLTGINDSGDLVGVHSSGAFLLSSGGALYTISYPGSTYTSVAGIANRKGSTVEVVGNYTDSNNNSHGFYAVLPLTTTASSSSTPTSLLTRR